MDLSSSYFAIFRRVSDEPHRALPRRPVKNGITRTCASSRVRKPLAVWDEAGWPRITRDGNLRQALAGAQQWTEWHTATTLSVVSADGFSRQVDRKSVV